MREIEFRAKDAVTNGWRYGDLLRKWGQTRSNNGNTSTLICGIITDENGETWNESNVVKPETIGQYIGKKDKNGVKIFTGDIIKFSGGGVWSVYYCEDSSMFRLRNGGLTCCVTDGKLYSIIGNTTDNPELLETAHA